MPFTPLHYPVAYLIHRASRRRLSLPALTVGCFTPDLEIPVLLYLTGSRAHDRLVLHSIIGSSTIGVLLSLSILMLVSPVILRLSGVEGSWRRTSWLNVAVSCLIGNLSHVFLDVTCHTYNPLLWPITSKSVINPFDSPVTAYWVMWPTTSLVMLVLFAAIVVYERPSTLREAVEKLFLGS